MIGRIRLASGYDKLSIPDRNIVERLMRFHYGRNFDNLMRLYLRKQTDEEIEQLLEQGKEHDRKAKS